MNFSKKKQSALMMFSKSDQEATWTRMNSNFHQAAFDDATLLKLEIYRQYIISWIPTFAKQNSHIFWNGKINIFDFFCGPGEDHQGQKGSPLIAVEECCKFHDDLIAKNRVVNLYFSDDKKLKVSQLENLLAIQNLPTTIQYRTETSTFSDSLRNNLPCMQRSANLLFIDQCGIKEVTPEIFRVLTSLKGTDFLFFISSSFFSRFKKSTEFKQYLDTTGHLHDDTPYYDTHRVIAAMYREMIPQNTKYYLAPFTLKKGANLYGLIFGSGNLKGILKFLTVCWEIDPERGEANFDIDNDNLPNKPGMMPDLFKDNERANKVMVFQETLEEKLLQGEFNTDEEVVVYTLEAGFLPTKHAKPIVQKLKAAKKLSYEGRLRLSGACINNPRSLTRC